MTDSIETFGRSVIEHGPRHERACLTRLYPGDAPGIVCHLDGLAGSRGYSKISARVPAAEAGRFVAAGYRLEASLPNFFPDGGAACFLAKYPDPPRKVETQPGVVREVLLAADAQPRAATLPPPEGFAVRRLGKDPAPKIASFFRRARAGSGDSVLTPSPAPNEGLTTVGISKGRTLVSLCAACVDCDTSSAEITALFTLPQCRGLGLSLLLLQQMDAGMLARGVRSVFAVVRACSQGINTVFARNGYSFAGTLTNHARISQRLESMNVWHKALPDDHRFAWSFLQE